MSGRSWTPHAEFNSYGLLLAAFSFQTKNIGTNPDVTKFRGCGGLTGGDGSGTGVSNSGPSFVASITKTANNGEFLVTLQDGYRAVWYANASVQSPAAGPGDGIEAQTSLATNEGSGNTTALTFLVTTLTSSTGNPVETLDRTVQVFLVLKNSGAGA